jgi:glutamate-1-semialdehyde 2,1-aminomutase
MSTVGGGIDLELVARLKEREDARFIAERPKSLALLERAITSMPNGVPMLWMSTLWDHPPMFVASAAEARFTDVDGHEYVDFNLGITVACAGHSPEPVVRAVVDRIARGTQFQLPTEDAVAASEALSARFRLPYWQYALSSSQAIGDAIRLARIATGRDRIVVFEGKYHGHLAATLGIAGDEGVEPEYLGIDPRDLALTVIVDWNDLDGLEAALRGGDVALVIAEPILSNSGLVLPADGFHDGMRRLAREAGALLLVDETQTSPMAFGGMTRELGLTPDLLVLGKSIGGGVPVAAYGMREELAELITVHPVYEVSGEAVDEPAIGGTLWGNALSMAALRAALAEVWTPATHERMQGLATTLADGVREIVRGHDHDWDVHAVGNRVGFRFSATPPRTNRDAAEADVPALRNLERVYLANRGVWEFGWWAGPAISAQTTPADVNVYLAAFAELLADITA